MHQRRVEVPRGPQCSPPLDVPVTRPVQEVQSDIRLWVPKIPVSRRRLAKQERLETCLRISAKYQIEIRRSSWALEVAERTKEIYGFSSLVSLAARPRSGNNIPDTNLPPAWETADGGASSCIGIVNLKEPDIFAGMINLDRSLCETPCISSIVKITRRAVNAGIIQLQMSTSIMLNKLLPLSGQWALKPLWMQAASRLKRIEEANSIRISITEQKRGIQSNQPYPT